MTTKKHFWFSASDHVDDDHSDDDHDDDYHSDDDHVDGDHKEGRPYVFVFLSLRFSKEENEMLFF